MNSFTMLSTDAIIVRLLDTLPASFLCILFVLGVIMLSQGGLVIFNWWHNRQKWQQSNEVAGIMFGALGLIYSLVLAFVIVAVWNNYDELEQTIEKESDKINNILAHTATLPDSLKQRLSNNLSHYCNQVLKKEWKMQKTGDEEHPSAIPSLRLMLLHSQPESKLQENIFSVIDQDLSDISDLRRARLNHTRSHVPDLVWLILKAGSIMMILFSYFLNVSSLKLKRIYLLFMVSNIAMCLFLVYTLDHPFSGSAQVSRKPYENILLELKRYYPAPNNKTIYL